MSHWFVKYDVDKNERTTASVLLTGMDPVDVGADVSDGTAVSLFDPAGEEVKDDMGCII